jgi:Na+-transporting NADH:ubiquinone oxidoreductase subunit NqrB
VTAATATSGSTLPQLPPRTWRGVPVVLPSTRDPRLRVSAVILSLQVLGQAGLNFKVSIAQILLTIGVCGIVEMTWLYYKQRAIIWPASALLTGNGVAFILRTSGTRHGQWWSLHGIQWFLLAALIGLASKYLLTLRGRHPYNPSNFGLIAVFLIVGSPHVFPQYLWWGPLDPPVLAALALILVGVIWILRPLGMLPMAAAFLIPFVGFIAGFGASGRCFDAIWSPTPVCGATYTRDICTSPELLIYVFYMMSDPRTAPRTRRGRIIYGVLTAVLAAGLIHLQPTEYGVKVALLAALTLICSVVPLIDRWTQPAPTPLAPRNWPTRLANPAMAAMTVVVIGIPIGLTALGHDHQLLNLERGISTNGVPATQ